MFEIELKARVSGPERSALVERLNQIAQYRGAVEKRDRYYALEDKKRCRIRIETPFMPAGQTAPADQSLSAHVFFTYKHKELRIGSDGAALEVNDEKECELTDAEPLISCLTDNGFTLALEKEKRVLSWQLEQVHIELCTVPPLGDFLELETFASDNDKKTVQQAQESLKTVLKKAGIAEQAIENRYYSELLKDARQNKEKKENVEEKHVQ